MPAANLADKIQVEEGILPVDTSDWKSATSDKNVAYVVDQQNGSYSNQISFDLTSLVAQNMWESLSESYILVPVSTTLNCSAALAAAVPANAVSIKDNFVNFIDSIQFFVNGDQLIDQTTYSNFPLQIFDKLTMSQDDLIIKGSALNISPDTTTSIRFPGATASTSGDGIVNNVFLPNAAATTLTSQDYSTFNEAIKKRNLSTYLFPSSGATGALALPTPLTTNTGAAQILAPYFSNDGTTKKQGIWNYVVYLPLKRLADLFAKYPLVKGSQMRLVLNFNSYSLTTTLTGSTSIAMAANPTMTAGNTVNGLISSILSSGISTSTTSTLTLTTRVQSTNAAAVTNTSAAYGYPALPQCRLYCPSYKVNPNYEEKLLANRTKRIRYIDWYQQPIIGVSSGSAYSQVLTTALPNVQFLVIVPFQNGASGLFNAATCSQYQSPFDTAPATTLPGGMLAFQNFNVSVSGVNQFNQNLNYTYDDWACEVQRIGLNGGLSRELSSGLVGLQEWQWSPFLVADISRRAESADKTYQSVTVSGTNNSGVKVDYYCFIAFQKEIEIDCLTGAVNKIF